MDNALKVLDYDKEIEAIRGEWYRQHPDGSAIVQPAYDSGGWIVSVRSDSVIVEIDNTMYEIAYTKDSEGIVTFASRADWQEVVREYIPAKNNALKALSRTDAELRVGNYIVLFGGRDLEGIGSDNINADGSTGEYFTADTDLSSPYTKAGALYVDWEHAQAEAGDDLLGVVDWKTARVDDKGVFVERVLQRRNQYVTWLEELGWFDDGTLGTSSHAEPNGVEKAADGEIARWPLFRDTITVSPMEPRMLKENQLRAFKALGIPIPAQDDTIEPLPVTGAEPEAGTPAVSVVKARVRSTLFLLDLMEV